MRDALTPPLSPTGGKMRQHAAKHVCLRISNSLRKIPLLDKGNACLKACLSDLRPWLVHMGATYMWLAPAVGLCVRVAF